MFQLPLGVGSVAISRITAPHPVPPGGHALAAQVPHHLPGAVERMLDMTRVASVASNGPKKAKSSITSRQGDALRFGQAARNDKSSRTAMSSRRCMGQWAFGAAARRHGDG